LPKKDARQIENISPLKERIKYYETFNYNRSSTTIYKGSTVFKGFQVKTYRNTCSYRATL